MFLVSKIFLTAQDSLADLVPDFWKPCVDRGLKGKDKNCAFAPDLLLIPGVAAFARNDDSMVATGDKSPGPPVGAFKAGAGVKPPRVTYQREPQFSDAARAAGFQGTVALSLVVNNKGRPTQIRISRPLGYGLDEKAVQVVEGWKFVPGEKDGIPVNVAIDVELEFRLY